MKLSLLLPLAAFFVVYAAAIVGSIALMRSRRKTKWPFKDSEKLLRGPGETLRKRILEFDDNFMLEFFGGIIAIPVVLGIAAIALNGTRFAEKTAFTALIGAFVAATAGSSWRITRLWKDRANNFLGWYGERIVADKLRPLQYSGYRVFHDFPCEPGIKGFNIDHVVVGPTGVVAVEVKSRRKFIGPDGHEVRFDGTKLIWPRGEDVESVAQAINQADWLAKWVLEKVGLKVAVRPVLTIPGWYVKESPSSKLRVVVPHFLTDAIRGKGEPILSAAQVDQISRWFDERCRDVTE